MSKYNELMNLIDFVAIASECRQEKNERVVDKILERNVVNSVVNSVVNVNLSVDEEILS